MPKYLFCIAVDGAWGNWGNWSQCNVTCADPSTSTTTGKMSRERLCNNPSPTGNGQDCAGSNIDEEVCTSTTACSSESIVYNSTTKWKIFRHCDNS